MFWLCCAPQGHSAGLCGATTPHHTHVPVPLLSGVVELQLLHQAQGGPGTVPFREEGRNLLLIRSAPGDSVASETSLPCRSSPASPRLGRGQAQHQRNPPMSHLPHPACGLPGAGRWVWLSQSQAHSLLCRASSHPEVRDPYIFIPVCAQQDLGGSHRLWLPVH